MIYSDKLKDKKWITLRNEVKRIYDNICAGCGNSEDIHVHHKKYRNVEPWDYKTSELIPLCATCHETFHKNADLLKNTLTNHRLMYSYEFDKINKMIEMVCKLETNEYSGVIEYLESKKIDTF